MTRRPMLLASAATVLLASPALAQQAPGQQPTDVTAAQPGATATQQPANAPGTQPDTSAAQSIDDYGEDQEIVVTGTRQHGSVVGDIPPENVLDSRDVQATGATSISELLDALAPQIGSARGRGGEQPVMLLNGQRISSFRELRDIPPEAIERVEILPEEVALKYGYSADQRVVNIVLRPRFRSTTAQARGQVATEGGYASGTGDLTRLMIGKTGRTQFNLHAQGNGMLTEAERNIILSQPSPTGNDAEALAARSLLGTKRDVRASAVLNRQVLGDSFGTLNLEAEHSEGRSLIGLGETLLEPLARNTSTDTAHAGVDLTGTKAKWHWTVNGNGDLARSVTGTELDQPATRQDRALETTGSGDLTGTANGILFHLPAGDASTTVTLGASTVHLDSERRHLGETSSTSLSRSTGRAAVNLDLPVSRHSRGFSALGNLTLNGNAEVDRLSDFGTLTKVGAGANWSPLERLNLISSWTREEGPPTVNQLGDPELVTPATRIFDFTTAQTVLVTAITGGNPNLKSDRRNVVKLGANWKPLANTDLRLRAEYVRQSIERPISDITVSPTIEQAFPDRFVRDTSGQLVSVDLRPVNFDSSRRDTIRIGFDFTKQIKSATPSASTIAALRHRAAAAGFPISSQTSPQPSNDGQGTAPKAPQAEGGPPPEGPVVIRSEGSPPPGGGGFRGGGGRGAFFFGGGGGGRRGGRVMLSLTDTITLIDQVAIRPGLPKLDYLHGDAVGQTGGRPRHDVEGQAAYFNNGLGARLGADWRSGTHVNSATGDTLHFSSYATFDLSLFANFGQRLDLVARHPWLRGTSVHFNVDNLLDSKPNVRGAGGVVPLNYQPGLLEPLGRTISISLRKLFLPPPSFFRRQIQEQQQTR